MYLLFVLLRLRCDTRLVDSFKAPTFENNDGAIVDVGSGLASALIGEMNFDSIGLNRPSVLIIL
jgi:hypothetical protein